MRHQNTCQNFFNSYQKKLNLEIPEKKIIKSKKIKHRRTLSFSNVLKKSKEMFCELHNLNFENYCLKCKEDICPECYKNSHFVHDTVKYEELSLNEKQIVLFKAKYDEYIDKYYELIDKIKEWQNILNKNIKEFEEFMETKIINVIKRMINEYNIDNLNYNTIIEYRTIYSLLLENNEDKLSNQKIIKLMKTYRSLKNYKDYKYVDINENLSTISSDIIQHYNDLIDKGNFEKKGNNIIQFLFINFSLFSKEKENNIIQKLEEIKQRNNNNLIRLKKTINKSSTNIFKNTSNNFKKILFNKDINIYEKKKVNEKKKNTETHLEKEELPIFSHKAPVKIQIEDDIKDNININSIINAKNRIKKENEYRTIWKNNKYYKKIDNYDELDDIDLDIDLNYNTENNRVNRRQIIFNNNINNFNSINNISNKNNYINNYQTEKIYSDRSHKSKQFTHTKFNSTLTGFRSTKDINILNQSQSDKEGAYNTIDFNNYNFDAYSNMINNNNLSNKIFQENANIRKVKIIEIDPKKDINIGFELGNSQCRISIINKGINDILIWQPYDTEEINIPTIISFKDNILIGKEAEEEIIKNPEYTIFNFLRLIGKNWNEIIEKKEFWGYKLYNNNKTERPYVKINHKNYKNKIYTMEDILTLFLKNIFELFFSKIKIKEKKCDLLKINFVITVPNNFNYLQRKVVEKIFLTQLFNRNSNEVNIYYIGKNGIQNIQIKNIKIENSSNLGFLYYFQKETENDNNEENDDNESDKKNNIILIYIEGSSVNISLINNTIISSKNNKKEENINEYEIKDIKWTSFGEEDFTDILEKYLLDEKIKEEYKKNKISLPQLRKDLKNIKNNLYKKNQDEIIIKNFNNKKNLKISLSKKDFEKKCNKQFNQIVELIQELLISENEIDDIIFIGNKTTVNIIKEKIEIIFKNKNKHVYEKLLERDNDYKIETNENFIAMGAAIQSYNIFSIEKVKRLYKFKEITPISFGIEGLNKKMIFMIKKGNQIPIKVNNNVKFKRTKEDKININIYEGEEEYSYKNRLISTAPIEITNFNDEIKGKDYIEIVIQFTLNQNYDLRVFILDTKTLKRKLECVININIVQE